MTLPERMSGWLLTGHGGPDKLHWRNDLTVPRPGKGQVLIRVHASSVNNTDINTRIGWYSKSVRGDTATAGTELGVADDAAGGWAGALTFPRIQGADCCGRIVAVGDGVAESRLDERVLVRSMQSTETTGPALSFVTFGSEYDGSFADYTLTPSAQALPVHCDWSDAELASIPCAYSTAEAMLQRIGLGAERVLITGASGGVGSAAIQLAKRRGAHVTAVTSPDKAASIGAIGADGIMGRDDPFVPGSADVILDLVGGPRWPALLDALRPGGRYVASGAIAGPIVELDLRTLYLRDLTLHGSTFQPDTILPDVITYIERGELRPLIAAEFPLNDLKQAQEVFLEKSYVGKIVIRHE